MKKYFAAYGILVSMLLAGILFSSGILNAAPAREVDAVAVNDIVKQAELCWDNPALLAQEGFAYRFVLIDGTGTIRFMTDEGMPQDLHAAIRQGFLPMDITVNGRVAGKVLIEVLPAGAAERERAALAQPVIAAFLGVLVLSAMFLIVLHRLIVRPFQRLEAFAHRLSTGRLDEPLPLDKHNLFGLFTQSFDLMRTSLLEERRSRLEAERSKKELIASVSHDIRTPVASIRAFSELLQLSVSDAAALEKLKAIEMKADQITRLTNDLLHSTLEELDELRVHAVPVESKVLRGIFALADPLQKTCVGEIPSCLIDMDLARMEQVIGNIIDNSYKYACTEIDVVFKLYDELLQIDLSDYGAGVAPEELALITEKFYRGENAKAMHKDGEGLGLYIAALLMEKGGGGLDVLNGEHGFTVRLLLPLSR